MHRYRELRVWQRAVALARRSYDVTDAFPYSEQKTSVKQIRRSAMSIAANIAEGCSRRTAKDFQRFIDIAMGSAYELDTHLEVLRDRGWATSDDIGEMQQEISTISAMLYRLKRSAVDQDR